ncbi:hypothetical protein ERO13_A05G135350v2 [Gossypium hirsutum]|nr:hypothetical protein ERO13_A05G135350v2 [Gossypium hirsutum]
MESSPPAKVKIFFHGNLGGKLSPLGPSCFVEVTRERQVLVLLSVIIMVGG